MSPPEFIVTIVISSIIVMAFFFAVPVRKAMLRKIEGAAPAHDPELLGELDHLRDRMGELEERLDFAERLLAQQRDAPELPPGGSR